MSSGSLVSAAIADTNALLGVLTFAAQSIDFSASVPAATSASGAINIAAVAGLSIIAQIEAVSANVTMLIAAPTTLASSLIGLVQAFAGTSADFRALADSLANVTWNWPLIAGDVNAAAIYANRAALQSLMVTQALVEAVRTSSIATFDSQQAAFALGVDLAARIDTAIYAASSRSLRASLMALKTALLADINTRAAQLDVLESWINQGEISALVLASRIYDDPAMAGDIVTRNAVANPLFLPAGQLTILAPGAAS